MKRILVTGGAGFIGSNFVHLLAHKSDAEIIVFDALAYAGTLGSIKDLLDSKRISFVQGDVGNRHQIARAITGCDAVVNFAAHSHVDRSIVDATPFLHTNAAGVLNILDSLREAQQDCFFLQVSTDEVYGDAPDHRWFTEADLLHPSNPYSASKAAGDMLVLSHVRTYGLRACITRCTNNYGPWQYPEKLVAMCITSMLDRQKIPIHGDGNMRRDWIYVLDHCDALLRVLSHGEPGQVYNIAGLCERRTIDIVEAIAHRFGCVAADVVDQIPDRPGNDRRYAISPGKTMSEFGWRPNQGIEDRLDELIAWYREHEPWWRHIMGTPHYVLHHETLRRGRGRV